MEHSTIHGKINGTVVPIVADPSSHGLLAIDQNHREVHEGAAYFIKGQQDVDGAGTIIEIMFTTPDTAKLIHAKAAIAAEAGFLVEIFEGITTSDDGTPVPGFNCRRDSANVAGLTSFAGPTVTVDGTLIWSAQLGSGRNSIAVSPGLNYELIVKRNTKYLFRITKAASGTHWVDTDFWWYEHTDKEVID